jgi:GDP-mannose 6-dehydrogenase
MKVAVFGLGYVGSVTAAVLAANGHEVRAVDVDARKVAMIGAGVSPVIEPGLHELVAASVAAGTLSATEDAAVALRGAALSLICVGTPSSAIGGTDLQFVARAAADIGDALRRSDDGRPRFHAVIVRSTVPPGTSEEVIEPVVLEKLGTATGIEVAAGMCPEFLREGTALADFSSSPLTVVGCRDPRVATVAEDLFGFLDDPVRVVPSRVAEALKYACNAFHATKVSFANELGRLFRQLGVDARDVMALFCEDTKLNISASYLSPGFAFGGSCLPKDLRALLYLARVNAIDLPLVSGTLATNALSVRDVVDRVVASGGRSIALLGLSFKMDSDDLRESPYVDVAETLIGKGFDVRIYDPIVQPANLVGTNRQYVDARLPHLQRVLTAEPAVALAGADVALVSNAHPAVITALCDDPPPTILDLSGRLGVQVEHLPGYEGVAW